MAAAKKPTKKDLESKIAELEAKLNQLSTQLASKPAETKPTPKPAETKPQEAPKPAETKPAETKPAETAKPAETTEPPKPAETETQPPATFQEALENAYYTAPMSSFHDYRAKVTGYSPAPNRYFVRRTAPVGTVPTTNWNEQKATVTGYTAPSNQYFATRARMAPHPADKTFGGFSGGLMSIEGVELKQVEQQAPPPPEAPKPAEGTLPKETVQTQQASANVGKSRKQQLEEYENEYLQRIEQERIAAEKAYHEAVAVEAQRKASETRGTLPKGFEPAPAAEPEAPKQSKGTLPKGF